MSKENMKEIMEQLKAANSDEERKQILESSKTALTDVSLEGVSGGCNRIDGENLIDISDILS